MREPDAHRVPGADAARIASDRQAAFDRQTAALAARLRDGGVEPARDLWPELSAALDAAGTPHGGARAGRRGARPAWPRWSQAALAASVVLAIGLGLTARGPAPGGTASSPPAGPAAESTPTPSTPTAASPAATAREGLRAVARALAEVEAALAQSPDDPDLSRLVLMIHHSRGRLLRLQAESGAREARRSPA